MSYAVLSYRYDNRLASRVTRTVSGRFSDQYSIYRRVRGVYRTDDNVDWQTLGNRNPLYIYKTERSDDKPLRCSDRVQSNYTSINCMRPYLIMFRGSNSVLKLDILKSSLTKNRDGSRGIRWKKTKAKIAKNQSTLIDFSDKVWQTKNTNLLIRNDPRRYMQWRGKGRRWSGSPPRGRILTHRNLWQFLLYFSFNTHTFSFISLIYNQTWE